MSERLSNAFEAALLTAIVGGVSFAAINALIKSLQGTALSIYALFGLLPSIFLATVAIWYVAFPDHANGLRRACWISVPILFFAFWGMFFAHGLFIDETYIEDSVPDAVGKSLLMALVFAIFGLLYTGIVVIPVGILTARFIRRRQIERTQKIESI